MACNSELVKEYIGIALQYDVYDCKYAIDRVSYTCTRGVRSMHLYG